MKNLLKYNKRIVIEYDLQKYKKMSDFADRVAICVAVGSCIGLMLRLLILLGV